jgi:hypothetical protein
MEDMFQDPSSNVVQAEQQNAPNLSFTATPVFGNMNFNIQAPQTDTDVQPGFPALPYISLEALIFFQGLTNPSNAPYTLLGGASAGQQVISSSQTAQDATGTSRYQIGLSNGNQNNQT